MFAFDVSRRPRRPSLTPMVDVVFLLLVFFMLAARFGPQAGLELVAASAGDEAWTGPPRLVEIDAAGVRLNGVEMDMAEAIERLRVLTQRPGDPILLRPAAPADTQDLVDALEALGRAGFSGVMLVE
ncbi:outer membrane transport energization protein ExbD [Rhodovulum bhavnagarense]|uniref:Outer membrane transport energization protein ExbD n=1 Tax=Rhodovulum bhavnagarense TaxID=992286 RepID=A0A4R2RH74_9RHOB|nr:biopolymer transporter ExbD [Rhodovulum bhavnagarense]TCP61958.1 outer membrane transport energization protein ExbD [Rhodovulum bhavnagarense]